MSRSDKLKLYAEFIKMAIPVFSIIIVTIVSGMIGLFLTSKNMLLISLGFFFTAFFMGLIIFLSGVYIEIAKDIEGE